MFLFTLFILAMGGVQVLFSGAFAVGIPVPMLPVLSFIAALFAAWTAS